MKKKKFTCPKCGGLISLYCNYNFTVKSAVSEKGIVSDKYKFSLLNRITDNLSGMVCDSCGVLSDNDESLEVFSNLLDRNGFAKIYGCFPHYPSFEIVDMKEVDKSRLLIRELSYNEKKLKEELQNLKKRISKASTLKQLESLKRFIELQK